MSDAKYQSIIDRVSEGLFERDEAVRLLILAALSGEHLLLVGPPGTAKSELARRLHQVFGGHYFERLLTRFSVPEELFGPLSLAALDEGRYERDIAGYLPCASIAFLDEVFKANSAILNALLTVLNERQFDQGSQRVTVPLVSLVAASNEVPDDENLRAFEDRFLLRCVVAPVSDDVFKAMLSEAQVTHETSALLSVADVEQLREKAATIELPDEVSQRLMELRSQLREKHIDISDRRWVRAVALLKICAATHGVTAVSPDDLWVLKALVGERADHALVIEDWYCEMLGADQALDPVWAARVADAFEMQLEREESATELSFDDSGKLSLMKKKGGVDEEAMENAAPRMSAFSQRKLYSATHIAARGDQIDQILESLNDFIENADGHRQALAERLSKNLWLPPALADRVLQNLNVTVQRVSAERERLIAVLAAYKALPLAESDNGQRPAPLELPELSGVQAQ
jgi:MoxR-like ATPase